MAQANYITQPQMSCRSGWPASGVGNPAQAAAMGASIFDVTLKYDEMALDYVRQHPDCRYIFLSSGAAYGASFDEPVLQTSSDYIVRDFLHPADFYQ